VYEKTEASDKRLKRYGNLAICEDQGWGVGLAQSQRKDDLVVKRKAIGCRWRAGPAREPRRRWSRSGTSVDGIAQVGEVMVEMEMVEAGTPQATRQDQVATRQQDGIDLEL
jgi:hypothetical protein